MLLIAFAGLPGSGKSTLADHVSERLRVPVFSVDPFESALVASGIERGDATGLAAYVAAEHAAERVLRVGIGAAVDAVNGVPEARSQWIGLAARTGATLVWVEVVCSDPDAHRASLEARRRDLPGIPEPDWHRVVTRPFAPWTRDELTAGHLVRLDSADPAASVRERLDAALDALR